MVFFICLVPFSPILFIEKKLDAFRPSEHPPGRGKMLKRLGSTVVETMSRCDFRPVSFYTILQYVYVSFNRTFPLLDRNRCQPLNRLVAYRKPDPSLSLSPKLLFRGGSHLPRRAGAPHPARHAGDHDSIRPA